MKSLKTIIAIAAGGVLLFNTTSTYAQQTTAADSALLDRVSALEQQVADTKPGEDHLMIAGLTTIGLVTGKSTNTVGGISTVSRTSTFGDADTYEFSPMFLWRHSDKFLMEFEPSFNNDGLSVNWADVSYFATPGLILRAGYMVIPFGIYNKRLAAGWIDKLATDPIGLDVPNSTDYGFEAMGGLPLGDMKWSYDVGVFNGMQLLPDGELQGTGITDNNINKTFSGRVGLLPFSNSSLEIGFSALSGKVGDEGSVYANAKANMYAFDLSTVQKISPFSVNIKAQYSMSMVNGQNYISPDDTTKTYTFTNATTAAFGQISIRPAQVKNKILKNLELAFRYVDYTTPQSSTWGQNYSEEDVALDYWLSWRTVLKVGYENIKSDGTSAVTLSGTQGSTSISRMIIQFSTEF